ncbi:amidohydrolase family protein [soil metagenome]
MIIDAHVHAWDPGRANYPWLGPGMGDLDRTIQFDEITPTFRSLGVTGAVLVQAADDSRDTDVMLSIAQAHPEILGVVGWSPLDDPRRLASDLERFSADPLIVGVRNLIHEHPAAWLDRPEVERGFALLAGHRVPLDFPTSGPAALSALPGIGARHPELTIVIDHLGKPPIGGSSEERAAWLVLIAECARNPLTVAKVSGLYSARGSLDSWTTEQVRPFVHDALELFGPDRLIYGGDWPISELAGGYTRTWDSFVEVFAEFEVSTREAVLGRTAARTYGLKTRS